MNKNEEIILRNIVEQEGQCMQHRWGCWECPLDDVCIWHDGQRYTVARLRKQLALEKLAQFAVEDMLKGEGS